MPDSALRIVYAGTPDFSVPALRSLLDSRHEVVAVYTQPDRPAGRGRKLRLGSVKQVAVDFGIPVEQPISLKTPEAQQTLKDYCPDVMIVAAYSLILPQAVLDIPRYGCLNIHASLLPRWRGAAPIHRAIQAGDAETGITIMQMDAGLDTGNMLLKLTRPIMPDSTGQSVHDQLAEDGAIGIINVLNQLQSGTLKPEIQVDDNACYAHKLEKSEGKIDWSKPAVEIDQLIRAFDAWPSAYTFYRGKPLKLLMSGVLETNGSNAQPGSVLHECKSGIDIMTGDGVLRVKRLQMPGGKKLAVQDFLNARSLAGECFPS